MLSQSAMIPMVVDSSDRGERAFDIYSLLLKERIVYLGSAIDESVANVVVAQLLYLNHLNRELPIHMYIHSPGGNVYAGLAIYDAMQMVEAPVSTVALGFAGSMATALLCAGASGKRYALPHATVHMHPTSGGSKGYTEDVRISTREQERIQVQLFHLMGKHSGHTWKEVEAYFLRDRYLNALEAKEFGLVDKVMGDVGELVVLRQKEPDILIS